MPLIEDKWEELYFHHMLVVNAALVLCKCCSITLPSVFMAGPHGSACDGKHC